MPKFDYNDAKTEALSWVDGSLLPTLIGARTVEEALTISQIIDKEKEKVTGIMWLLWGKNEVRTASLPLWLSLSDITLVKNAASRVQYVKNEINKIEQKAQKEPINSTELATLKTSLEALWAAQIEPISSSRETIILFAGVMKKITEQILTAPDHPVVILSTIPTFPPDLLDNLDWFTIEGDKNNNETVQILSGGQELSSDTTTGTSFKCWDLQWLKNGKTKIIVRVTNPTTKVYSEISYNVKVDLPEAPDLNQNIEVKSLPAEIRGKLKNHNHSITLYESNGTNTIGTTHSISTPWTAGVNGEKIQIFPDGSFIVTIPDLPDRTTSSYQIGIQSTGTSSSLKLPVTLTTNLPDLTEQPEWMQENIEVTTHGQKINIWKLKKGQKLPNSMKVINKTTRTYVMDITVRKTADGMYYFELPNTYNPPGSGLKVENGEHEFKFDLTDWGATTYRKCEMNIKVNIPKTLPSKPEKISVIDMSYFKQELDKVKKTWTPSTYHIKDLAGTSQRLSIERSRFWKKLTVQIPDSNGNCTVWNSVITSKDPQEIITKLQERIKQVNDSKLYEYNHTHGIIVDHPETPQIPTTPSTTPPSTPNVTPQWSLNSSTSSEHSSWFKEFKSSLKKIFSIPINAVIKQKWYNLWWQWGVVATAVWWSAGTLLPAMAIGAWIGWACRALRKKWLKKNPSSTT